MKLKLLIFNFALLFYFFIPYPIYAVNLDTQYAFGGAEFSSLGKALRHLIGPAFNIAAIAVTFYLIIGAFRYITSGGDKQALEKARAMITHAIIGFLLLMLMFLVLQYIPEAIGLKGFSIIQ